MATRGQHPILHVLVLYTVARTGECVVTTGLGPSTSSEARRRQVLTLVSGTWAFGGQGFIAMAIAKPRDKAVQGVPAPSQACFRNEKLPDATSVAAPWERREGKDPQTGGRAAHCCFIQWGPSPLSLPLPHVDCGGRPPPGNGGSRVVAGW